MEREIICPSGLRGVVRGLTVAEANKMASGANDAAFDELLKGCWVRTVDPGIYGDGELNWNKALTCDRFWTLVQIRIATYGPTFSFKHKCSACDKRSEHSLNLTELPFKDLPEETRASLKQGSNSFVATAGGWTFTFRLQTGEDERKLAKIKPKHGDLVSQALMNRIVAIEGNGAHPNDRRKIIDSLPLAIVDELGAKFDEFDGGVETNTVLECDYCGEEEEITIPFGEGFFASPKRRRNS